MSQVSGLNSPAADKEISLLDLAIVLARKKNIILSTILVLGTIGLVVAVTAPPEYRTSITVMSELGGTSASAGGLGSALRNFGLSLPGTGSRGQLSTQAIPAIAGSRSVLLAVARDSLWFPSLGGQATLIQYLQQAGPSGARSLIGFIKSWTIGLPGKLVRALFGGPLAQPDLPDGQAAFLTEPEEKALGWLAGSVSTTEDVASGLITIAAVTPDPMLASQLVTSVARQLERRVQAVYTQKTRQTLYFVESEFEKARQGLAGAGEALAAFQDRNQGLTSSRLRIQEQRLQREVTFTAQLYSELQAQLAQAQIDLQKSQPVITPIGPPLPQQTPSGPNRKATVLSSIIIGGLIGVMLALIVTAWETGRRDPVRREKLAEIGRVFRGFQFWSKLAQRSRP
jgi:uncharacterized protein involved in exopolysaccharide biosynthesis